MLLLLLLPLRKHASGSSVASAAAGGRQAAVATAAGEARVSDGRGPLHSQGCWGAMPGGREDEICQKALQLLAELCSVGAVEHERCLEFNYYLRDSARPRSTDSGKPLAARCVEEGREEEEEEGKDGTGRTGRGGRFHDRNISRFSLAGWFGDGRVHRVTLGALRHSLWGSESCAPPREILVHFHAIRIRPAISDTSLAVPHSVQLGSVPSPPPSLHLMFRHHSCWELGTNFPLDVLWKTDFKGTVSEVRLIETELASKFEWWTKLCSSVRCPFIHRNRI